MPDLGEIAVKIRSKNAGPFWLTIDIFCGDAARYDRIQRDLSTDAVAACLQVPVGDLKRFDIPDLHVVKISLPRPVVQGSIVDRDMHGASWGARIAELTLP